MNKLHFSGFQQTENREHFCSCGDKSSVGISFVPKEPPSHINTRGISSTHRQPIQITQPRSVVLSKAAAGSQVTLPQQSSWGKWVYLTTAILTAALGILAYVGYKYFNPQIPPKSPDAPSADRISIPSLIDLKQIAGFGFMSIILGADYWFFRHPEMSNTLKIVPFAATRQ